MNEIAARRASRAVQSALTEEQLNQNTAEQPSVVQRTNEDPAADVLRISEDRAATLVNNISESALAEMTAMRNELDDLMRDIRQSNDKIISDIVEQTRKVARAIQAKVIIKDALIHLRRDFTPGTGSTIENENKS